MDIEQIKCFCSAAEIKNFSAAAEENNISQSSLSKKIMALENELRVKLFDRNRRAVSLTQAGEIFFIHARRLLSQYESMMAEMAIYADDAREVIRLASIPVMYQYGVTESLVAFRRKYPQIQFSVSEMESQNVSSVLRQGKFDLGILRTNYLDKESYHVWPLMEDRLVLIVGKDHPLAERERVQLAELKDERFLLPNRTADLFNICEDACFQAGFKPKVLYDINGRVEMALSLTESGDGVALVMRKVIESVNHEGVSLIEIEPPVRSTTALVRLIGKGIPSYERKFIEFLQQYYKSSNAINDR